MTELEVLRERILRATANDRGLFDEVAKALLGEFWASENRALFAFWECGAWTDLALGLVAKKLVMPGYSLRFAYEGMGDWGVYAGVGTHGNEHKADLPYGTIPLAILHALLSALANPPSPSPEG